jgi:NADH-quinone oxidoreductase subunit J
MDLLYINLISNDVLLKSLMIISLIFGYVLSSTKNPIYSALSLIVVLIATSLLLWFIGAEFLAMMYIIVYLGAVAVLFLFVVMMLNIDQQIVIKKRKTISALILTPFFYFFSKLIKFFAYFFKKFAYFFKINNNKVEKVEILTNFNFNFIFNSIYKFFDFIFFILFLLGLIFIIYTPLNFYENLIDYKIIENNNLFLKLHSSNYLQNTAQIGELLYIEFGFLFILSSFILLIAMIGTILLTLKKNNVIKKQSINRQVNKNLKNSISLYKIKNYKK